MNAPARAELHLLHPERHDKAHEAERVLRQAQPILERAAGGPVIGSVAVRSDPMDAIEETIFSEPIDEIMLSVAPHGLSTRLHQDLSHASVTSVSPSPWWTPARSLTRPAATAWSRCASGRSRVAT